jgi:hypothetical protein
MMMKEYGIQSFMRSNNNITSGMIRNEIIAFSEIVKSNPDPVVKYFLLIFLKDLLAMVDEYMAAPDPQDDREQFARQIAGVQRQLAAIARSFA